MVLRKSDCGQAKNSSEQSMAANRAAAFVCCVISVCVRAGGCVYVLFACGSYLVLSFRKRCSKTEVNGNASWVAQNCSNHRHSRSNCQSCTFKTCVPASYIHLELSPRGMVKDWLAWFVVVCCSHELKRNLDWGSLAQEIG